MKHSDNNEIRQSMLAVRQRIENRSEKNQAIAARLLPFLDPDLQTAAYMPIRGEADVSCLLKTVFEKSEKLVFPKVRKDGSMIFLPGTHMIRSAWGILEPAETPDTPKQGIIPQVMIVPMTAFHNTFRLGYGGGYYDRYLAAHPNTFTIGIAYDEQEADFQIESWDVPLNLILTPTRTIALSQTNDLADPESHRQPIP